MKVAVTTLAFCVAALLALGLVMLYSAAAMQRPRTSARITLMMQLVWCALGFALCVTATALDYQWLKKRAWPLFIFALVLLVLVFAAIAARHRQKNQRRAPLDHPARNAAATVRTRQNRAHHHARVVLRPLASGKCDTFKRGVVFPGSIIAAALGLIFVEPDRGTTILLAAVSGIDAAGRGRPLETSSCSRAAAGAAALAVSILHDPMRMNRICSWCIWSSTWTASGFRRNRR